MAFAGLLIVGVSAGIFLIGKAVMDNPVQIVEENSPAELPDGKLEFGRILEKMGYIQEIVENYYLFEEDEKLVEDGIYTGLMYGLDDPILSTTMKRTTYLLWRIPQESTAASALWFPRALPREFPR